MLLDITVSSGLLGALICGLVAITIAIIGLGNRVISIFYNGLMNRFDRIDNKLEPLLMDIVLHTEQIKEIKSDQEVHEKWLSNHDGRIQAVERKVGHN